MVAPLMITMSSFVLNYIKIVIKLFIQIYITLLVAVNQQAKNVVIYQKSRIMQHISE